MNSNRYKSYIIVLLMLVYTSNYLDRQIFTLLMEPIKLEFGLSDTQLGFLSGIAFAMFYATLGIPIARFADRANRVNIISISCILWSFMTLASGLVMNFLQLALVRVGVGIGEAGCTPPAHSLIADYFEKGERAKALCIYSMGIPLGILVGYASGGWIAEFFGWRAAFFIVGVPGIILALLVKFTIREPERKGHAVSTRENTPGMIITLKTLWGQATFRNLLLSHTLTAVVSSGIGQWLAVFFSRYHDLTGGALGTWLALVSGGAGALGLYLGGYMVDKYFSTSERSQIILIILIGSISIPLNFVIYLTGNMHLALGVLFISSIVFFFTFGPFYALVQSLAPVRMRATAIAVVLFMANLIGLGLGPQLVGLFSDLLVPYVGDESLRWAILLLTPCSLVSIWFGLKAAGTVRDDLAEVEKAEAAEISALDTIVNLAQQET